ncbi:quinolinate synthase NadA [Candidatus Fermentibacteria bacterium]|nr:quinolinate synthase NadA [Candidatus Fermentibacteria bacterium]
MFDWGASLRPDPVADIERLRRSRNAVILAHCYQPPEIQDLADFVGDSLGLSRTASETECEVIVFCGVRFMAETAHILSPDKIVLQPRTDADCSLADCMGVGELSAMKEKHPDALPVCYVNSSVEVKAESYACCTSANALKVVDSVPSSEVVFGPDRNLGTYVSRHTDKTVHVFRGACEPHSTADLADLDRKIEEWPEAEVMVHPETPPDFWDRADAVTGTGGMVEWVEASRAERFLVGTEKGMVYRLQTLFPERSFREAGGILCRDMKLIDLEHVASSLGDLEPRIEIDEALRKKARESVERMVELT